MSSPDLVPHSSPARYRPVGLVLAALVLGLLAGIGLLSGFSMIVSAFAMTLPQNEMYSMVKPTEIVMGIVMVLINGFCALVVAGLFLIKKWARWFAIVIGVLTFLFSGLCSVVLTTMAFIPLPQVEGTNAVSPPNVKVLFLGMAVFFFVGAMIGVWWVVYFSLRHVRLLFANGDVLTPVEATLSEAFAGTYQPMEARREGKTVQEILLICFAVLYLVSAPFFVVLSFFHLPIFLFGVVFRGAGAFIVSWVIAAMCLSIGIGLLRRSRLAWTASLFWQCVGVVSILLVFLPGYRRLITSYAQEVSQRMAGWGIFGQSSALPPQTTSPYMNLVGLLPLIAAFWLLLWWRPLFERRR